VRISLTAILAVLVVAATAATAPPPATAQDLEPRAYSPSPIGTTFVAVSATRSAGGVFTDPSVPITNVEATLGVLGLAAGHTFELFGRQALFFAVVPVAWGDASGDVGEVSGTASRRGLADPRLRLSMILKGSPAMTPAEFAKAPRRTILGVSLTVVPPLGQYDPEKLVNLGTNRWSFKPEIGLSYPAGRWTIDTYGALLLFTSNDEYYPGSSVRRQDPIFAVQSHLSYTFARRYWAAINGTWYSGGRSSVNGVDKEDLQRNTRLGATLSIPVGARQSIKIAYSTGATTRTGADFQTVTAAWQIVYF
jgi:hypothetical protein